MAGYIRMTYSLIRYHSAVTVAAQVGAGLPTKGTPTGQAVAGPCKLPSHWIPLTAHIGLRCKCSLIFDMC